MLLLVFPLVARHQLALDQLGTLICVGVLAMCLPPHELLCKLYQA